MRNSGDTWSLPPFHRAQYMGQKCIIVEFYGALYSIKMVFRKERTIICTIGGTIRLCRYTRSKKCMGYQSEEFSTLLPDTNNWHSRRYVGGTHAIFQTQEITFLVNQYATTQRRVHTSMLEVLNLITNRFC